MENTVEKADVPARPEPISVLLVDDHAIWRGGVRSLIEPPTEREAEVLHLLATGLSNRDIASVLFVAESTVKTHVEPILGKLGVSDRVQAAVWAARHGLGPAAEKAASIPV